MTDPIQNPKNYYLLNTPYAITLNPIDKYQYLGSQSRLSKFRNHVYENLINLNPDYHFVIEISEPRSFQKQGYAGPRLHLHGVIIFKTSKQLHKFLMNDYYNLTRWTSIDIDTINDMTIWSQYCFKQKIIKKNQLSKSDTGILKVPFVTTKLIA